MLSLLLILKSPVAQTNLARIFAGYMTRELGTIVQVDKIRIGIRNIIVKGLYVEDHRKQPLIDSKLISIAPSRLNFAENRFYFREVLLDSTLFNLRNYSGEEKSNLTRITDFFKGDQTDSDTLKESKIYLSSDKVTLNGCHFILFDEEKQKDVDAIDYADMDISSIDLGIRNLEFTGDTIKALIEELSAREKSGFILKAFKGNCTVSSTGFTVDDLELKTNESSLFMDLAFDYYHYQAFNEFIDSVRMMADIRPSRLQMRDIGYFTETLKVMDNELKIECGFTGTVADFLAEDLKFSFGKAMKFDGNVSLAGLPDIYDTKAGLNINYLYVNKEDIESFALPIEGTYLEMPEELYKLGDVKITGSFNGVYNDFISKARIDSEIGSVLTDLEVIWDPGIGTVKYDGNLSTKRFDLGNFLAIDQLGEITMQAEVNGKGITAEDVALYLTAWIDTLGFYGNSYEQMVIGGELSDEMFNGRFLVDDRLASVEFTGLVDFERSRPLMNFKLNVRDAWLYKMNIVKRSEDARISGKAEVIVDFASPDDWMGTVRFDTVKYTENEKEYSLDSLTINGAIHPDGPDWLRLGSDILDIAANGDFTLTGAWPDLERSFLHYLHDSTETVKEAGNQSYLSLTVDLKQTEQMSELFMPSLNLSPGSVIAGSFNSYDNDISFRLTSDWITFGNTSFDDVILETEPVNDSLEITLSSRNIVFREKDPEKNMGRLGLDNFFAGSKIANGDIRWRFRWDDVTDRDLNIAEVKGLLQVNEERETVLEISNLDAVVNGDPWRLEPGNKVLFGPRFLSVKDFNLRSSEQQLLISGVVSGSTSDTIDLVFNNWDLTNFNPLISSSSISVEGFINGQFNLTGIYSNPSVISDISVKDFSFNEEYLGELLINTEWINADSSLKVRTQILEQGNISQFRTVDIEGFYYPLKEEGYLDFDIEMNNLNLAMGEPFLESVMSDISGLATGKLSLRGSLSKPVLSGKLNLMRTELLIDYLNVSYSLAHDVYFDENLIFFEDAIVYDSKGNRVLASMNLSHDYFSDFYLDLNLQPDNALAMNTTRYMNEVFYGKAFASGNVSITGPFDDLTMDIDATSSKGTDVIIPIQYSVDVSQSDFIVFTSELEKEEEEVDDAYKTQVKGLKLNLDLNVNRNADLQLYLPGDMGFIRARGDGDINMGIDSRGYFTINGNYRISDGLFNFNLEQLLSKRFQIREGSRITWNGDIYDADINIAAIFKTKTTLAGLGMALPQGAENQRVNVHLYVLLTENLFNPNIRFSIRFPYLQEAVKSNIYAVMDTTDNSVMNQQAISLLVLNSFSSPGYASTASPINSYSIIANQLSSILSKISNDFDIGVNYIPGDEISREEVEVALSTQLFNNRLIIDGNVDVPTSNNANSQNTSNIVGEVNVEYKLTEDGRFRVKAFNRSNNLNMLEQYAPYTQGVGLFYRREFDNLGELFRRDEQRKRIKKDNQKEEKDNVD